jgi:large subunit ribosomal protein L6
MSRIGKRPVEIPQGIKVSVKDGCVFAEGPKGKLQVGLMEGIAAQVEDNKIVFTRSQDSKTLRAYHGLCRNLVKNIIIGVNQGYQKNLEIQGVGYRAQAQGKVLNMQLGFSHPVNFPIPEGITIETPKPTQIIVKGIDKYLVGQTAADIRKVYPPEPYKGRGIRYVGEYVRRKVGKAVA